MFQIQRLFREFPKFGIIFFCSVFVAAPAHAVSLHDDGAFSLKAHGEIGAFYAKSNNTGYRSDDRVGGEVVEGEYVGGERRDDYNEFILKAGLSGEYLLGENEMFYGEVEGVATSFGGDGDFSGGVGSSDSLGLELAYFGWRNGTVDLSFGRQELQIGTGFLIWDGNADNGYEGDDDGTFWLTPRNSFNETAIARIDVDNIHADLFWVKAHPNEGEPSIAGANVEYASEDYGTFAAMYLKVLDEGREGARDGMHVYSARMDGLKHPALPGFEIHGEVVVQSGSGNGVDYEGDAWYIEPSYTFSDMPWTPRISYRYSDFSGDDDPDDNDNEEFDPLLYGFADWGTWYQGEIVGEYILGNSNQETEMFRVTVYPSETVTAGFFYFDHELDEETTPGSGRNYSDEYNVYIDWAITEDIAGGVLYAVSDPDDAAEAETGDDETYSLFQFYIGVSF